MKKTFLSLFMLTIMSSCFSQEIQSQPKHQMTREDYLKKSKNQKTFGLIMIFGGSASTIAGAAVMANDVAKAIDPPFPEPDPLEESNGVGPALFITGLAAVIGGIVFTHASRKNKRIAMSISFKDEIIPGRRPSALSIPSMPVASLTIKF